MAPQAVPALEAVAPQEDPAPRPAGRVLPVGVSEANRAVPEPGEREKEESLVKAVALAAAVAWAVAAEPARAAAATREAEAAQADVAAPRGSAGSPTVGPQAAETMMTMAAAMKRVAAAKSPALAAKKNSPEQRGGKVS